VKEFFFILALLSLAACAAQAGTLEPAWSTPDTLKIPESVKYDGERGYIYVSSINGNPTDDDGNGFISRLGTGGEILELRWIEGISAPKGMGISGNTLYVTDITRLVEIDLEKGEITGRYDAEGSEFLNDVAVDDSGNVYVSDMSADVIYLLEDHSMKVWLEEGLERPNGLFYSRGVLYIGASGVIKAVDTGTGETLEVIETGFGVDGLVSDGAGGLFASDWKGKTVHIDSGGEQEVLLDTSGEGVNSADIEYIIEKSLLIIPTFMDNRAVAYRIGSK
jgi:sugar lactone lactonase YvrE